MCHVSSHVQPRSLTCEMCRSAVQAGRPAWLARGNAPVLKQNVVTTPISLPNQERSAVGDTPLMIAAGAILTVCAAMLSQVCLSSSHIDCCVLHARRVASTLIWLSAQRICSALLTNTSLEVKMFLTELISIRMNILKCWQAILCTASITSSDEQHIEDIWLCADDQERFCKSVDCTRCSKC